MIKVNFKKLVVPLDVKGLSKQEADLAEEIANLIYRSQSTIQARRLAEKIFDSQDEIELNESEEQILKTVLQACGTLQVQDAIFKLTNK